MDVKRMLQALAIGAALLTAIVEVVKLAREVHPGSSTAEPTQITGRTRHYAPCNGLASGGGNVQVTVNLLSHQPPRRGGRDRACWKLRDRKQETTSLSPPAPARAVRLGAR